MRVGASGTIFLCRFALAAAIAVSCAQLAKASTPNQHHFPFETLQPGVGPIVLTYQGDELFNYYEDEGGFTVVLKKGRYYYAQLDKSGNLSPTSHLVGAVDPSELGLTPGTLPSESKVASLRSVAMDSFRAMPDASEVVVPEDSTLIDGCIMVRNSQMPSGDAGGTNDPQNGTYITSFHWPDGIVPYTFDGTVNSTNQQLMRDAMDAWEAIADVQFIPRTTEINYVEVISGSGNWSYVGQVGGRQQLSIYNWSYQFIIMHELAHALGVWHEQSRPDRDTYVQIESGNIQSGMEHNFDKQTGAGTDGSYDFDSIMHYGQCAFSNCSCSSSCRTITVLAPNQSYQNTIGQRSHLSTGDADTMQAIYGDPVPDGASQMTTPAASGDLIDGATYTFVWSNGTGVSQYQLLVGTTSGGSDLASYTGSTTSRTVSGLPTDGSTIYVSLKSQISSVWYTRNYAYGYGDDICPGHDDSLDADADGVPDGCDVCPGEDDTVDTDGDDTPDCLDECPNDANKTEPGDCGCGHEEVDSDDDGVSDCVDECPNNPLKTTEGICGCEGSDVDSDGDSTPDCNDECPNDPNKINPGLCGCGSQVRDFDGDGDFECDNGSGTPVDPGGTTDRGVTPVVNVSVCGAGGAGLFMPGLILAIGVGRRRRRRR
ncbi:MAG: M12 family metallopeptidase [Phycisphaerales bacterium]|nr:M12 family metallopeptidase [Phycisphaerales bacterium]MCB9855010.1 M12 family metallopeptidase [Phycisphaerales bacterium]MCB9863473.1 M12 family metallopeptidase [Phycisphaerales bacterium]